MVTGLNRSTAVIAWLLIVLAFSWVTLQLERREDGDQLDRAVPVLFENLNLETRIQLFLAAELANIPSVGRIVGEPLIALGADLSVDAVNAIKASTWQWTEQDAWPNNANLPPPGTVLVRTLSLNGAQATVSVVVGEQTGPVSCGYHVMSSYSWIRGWRRMKSDAILC